MLFFSSFISLTFISSFQPAVKSLINFKIISVTSQDHEHPALDLAEQLNTQVDHSLDEFRKVSTESGWHTQRFCLYPQDLVIMFPAMVKLQSIQILMH